MFNKINYLTVETSTRCNAWCPSCPRNNNGFGLSKFTITDLDPVRLDEVIRKLPSLKTIQVCGNFGDPCASKLLNEQLAVIKKHNIRFQLHTNGSLRSKKWWKKFALDFAEISEVWFAIDGLEDTHSIYRQGTNWKKIIDNAKEFINAGGSAVWQLIPFAHNEHQIIDCFKLSTKLGFKRFKILKNARYKENNYHYRTGEPIEIKPWSKFDPKKDDVLFRKKVVSNKKLERKNCMHLEFPSLYLNAYGRITPCCYWADLKIENANIENMFATNNLHQLCVQSCGN